MPTSPRKKLIEVSIPLEAINKASAREKSIRHGHPSTLHLWWARRPLAACRAVLFAQLVDDPSAWPEKFPTEAEQEKERLRLHRVIEDMVPWEASNNEAILNAARWEIARSVAWGMGEEPPEKGDGNAILAYLQEKAPPVYDPFSGGGSIPLEAQRLGLRAYGSDLNPVAVLIGKALVEIPPKFAGLPPVNPKSQAELKRGRWNGKGAQGLAEDVRYYGQWMRDEAEKRIGHLYPKAQLADGSEATVIAWLWARTVRSPDPAARGAMVPLVSNFMLSSKEGKKAWAEPVIDPSAQDGWRFEVKTGTLSKSEEELRQRGTKGMGRGSTFGCVLTGSVIDGDYIKAEGMAGRMGSRLIAIVAEGHRSRSYISPTSSHEAIASELEYDPRVEEARQADLNQPVPSRLTGGTCYSYGLTTFGKLFSPRQLVVLTSFSDLVAEAREKALFDARAAGLSDRVSKNSDISIVDDEDAFAAIYADAVATYLGETVSKLTAYHCTLGLWRSKEQKTGRIFGRQSLPMVWDYPECNPFAGAGGDWEGAYKDAAKVLAGLGTRALGVVEQGATQRTLTMTAGMHPVISTDPPYYDNVAYADLSDFYYVWLRRTLGSVFPEAFRRLLTQKDDELVATAYRHGGPSGAENFFLSGMSQALKQIAGAVDGFPTTIYYAFKQSEESEDGATSAGWSTFLQAIVDAGLSIDGTWPVRTEQAAALKSKVNALASSVVLVCRKRNGAAATTDRAGFTAALRRELPRSIASIRAAGVGPVDMQQSVIGPGMGVFTTFAEVLDDDDKPLSVKTALAIINRVWQEIDNELARPIHQERSLRRGQA